MHFAGTRQVELGFANRCEKISSFLIHLIPNLLDWQVDGIENEFDGDRILSELELAESLLDHEQGLPKYDGVIDIYYDM